MAWHARVLLAMAFLCLFQCTEQKDENDVLWRYQCFPARGCRRLKEPSPRIDNSTIFPSLDVCRTVCGHNGGLWPKPTAAKLTMETVYIHTNNLRYDLSSNPRETIELLGEMTKLTTSNIHAECGGEVTHPADKDVVVYVEVHSANTEQTLQVADEQYTLEVKPKDKDISVTIVANTIYGARHALESFSQLVASEKFESQCGLKLMSQAKIEDSPRYPYRGLLLDTSRNFIPMRDIKRMIDGMAATKMNVFHWHITDSQSFPLHSKRVPQFTRYGAYSAAETYSIDEIEELILYAQVRGVRIMIEIDAPAHAGNGWQWGKEYGIGELAVCVERDPWRRYCVEPPCGQLNPANMEMYRILKQLYMDIAEMLPKKSLFHMGGDEVHIGCWNSTPEVTSHMKDRGIDTDKDGFMRLWAEFHSRALHAWDEAVKAAGGSGKDKVVLWSSELTKSNIIERFLNNERYIIEVWEPALSPLLLELLQLGYTTISVPKDVWYLDHGLWGVTKYSNWRRMYEHMLPRHPNMLGGEAAMWTEYVDIGSLDSRIWPRAAAVGERLWSDPHPPDYSGDAERRLQRHRRRLAARALRPDALGPEWCDHNDGGCM